MPITIAAVRENAPNERRVALTPEVAKKLKGLGADLLIEKDLGVRTHVPDAQFAGVDVAATASEVIARANVLLKVQPPSLDEIAQLREGSVVIGYLAPHGDAERIKALRDRKLTAFAMELLPRTTRAQAMDVLSSQAGMAGYKAVLIAATLAPRFFPMLTTAAGTIRPSKVLVVGAGVAGLQAIATARRLGAQVEGFDVRPETREQIESLGARFLDLGVSVAGEGGYARALTEEERAEQQRRLGAHLRGVDVLVCTAAVPGRPAPRIVSAGMVAGMKPGSVIVDLAAESGGNCELTRPGEEVDAGGVVVAGPLGLASMGAVHASEMFARNVFNFMQLLLREGGLAFDWDDELLARTVWPEREDARARAAAAG
jgi:H+-translocating NAD(P) transhydrogenase subunit alpha